MSEGAASGSEFWGAIDETDALQRFRTLVNVLDDGLFQLDRDGRFVAVNDPLVELTGYAREDLLGANVSSVFAEGTRIERAIDRQLDADDSRDEALSVTIRGGDAEADYCELRLHPVLADGEFDGTVGILRADVTETKRLELELTDVFERISDAFFALDEEFRITHLNEEAASLLGRTEDELLGNRLGEVFPGSEEVEAVRGLFEVAMETQEPRSVEHYSELLGSWVEANVYPSESGVSVYFRDVTDRKVRERELRRKERRYEAVFEDPNILVGLLEPDGTVVDINETAMEYVDADLETVTGRPFWETPWWGEGAREEVREWTERAAEGEYVDFQADLTRPDGETYAIEGYFRPVTDEDGEVVSIIVSDRDVTERKRRERELEESERRYRTLVENFPNGAVALVDEDLRYRTVGGKPSDTADVTAEEAEGTPVADAVSPAVAEHLVPAYEAALDGEHRSFELERDDRIYQFQVVPVCDEDGSVFGALGMSQDVTDRKRAERELERHTQQLETLFEVLPIGVLVADADGELVKANGTAREIWGGDVFDAKSVREYEKFPIWWADTGERVDTDELTLTRVLDGEEVTEPDVFEIEAFDGERRIVRVEGMPVRDEHGDVTRGVITFTDITERREAQRQLAESERRYRTLVENFPNGAVGLFDEDLQYQVAGGQAFEEVGATADEVVGKTLWDRYPDEVAEFLEPKFRAAIAGETTKFEWDFHDRHWLSYTIPVRDEDDEVFAGMIMVQDVTEREERERRLEELVDRLEESNERLEQFAYAASHDLQEPLRMVSSYLRLVEDRYAHELDADGREFLEYAVDGADRMSEMIEGLLEYSRVETRGDPFEPVDLNEVLADVRADLRVKIEESDADVTVEELPRVEGDPSQLRQVFQNLLENAIEYSGDEPPRVTVEAERSGDEWLFSVSDEGIGIDPDDQERVFEVFQRLHTHEEHAGTGIGLSLCRRIVERHGGEMWVESEPGEGSTFAFTLPTAEGSEE